MPPSHLRLLFMGTPEFAVPVLKMLIDRREQVLAVITQPDRPKGRGHRLAPPPVKLLAQEAGIEVLQPTRIKTPEFLDQLAGYRPDLILVAAYGRILTPAILALPRLGCLNVHGSLLPKYRGAAPIQTAILRGEAETGVTIMQMDAGLDTGDMLLAGKLPIGAGDTAASLIPRLAELGGGLLLCALDQAAAGRLDPVQQDHALATLAPPLSKEDGRIDWSRRAFEISCQIRAFDPWPHAFTALAGRQLKPFSPVVLAETGPEPPGAVVRADRAGLVVACGQGRLMIGEVQAEGKRRMPVADFLRGQPLAPGTTFG